MSSIKSRAPQLLPRLFATLILPILVAWPSMAQSSWTAEQQEVIRAIGVLSASTSPTGEGADAYGAMLADDFSRWTIASETTSGKEEWVEGIREWFDDGWSVSDRESQYIQIDVRDAYAFVRRNVKETYLGPDGSTSSSNAALAEVWVRRDTGWKLLQVNVHPIPNE